MVFRGIITCTILILFFQAHSQSGPDSLRSTHIRDFADHSYVGAVLKQRNLNFRMTSRLNADQTFLYKPNTSYSTGLALSFFNVGIEATVSIPINVKNQERYGASKVKDLSISSQGNQWLADAYLQKYSGFYVNTPIAVNSKQTYEHRSDLKAANMGVSFTYIFNHKKFSMRSAYLFTEQQKSNSGSVLFSYVLSSFNLSADSALVPSAKWKDVGAGSSVKNIRFTSLGIAPGYSYNFIYKKFFVNTTLTLGPAHYWIEYQFMDGTIKNDIRINFYSSFRIGLGYNGDHFFSGISYSTHGRSVRFEEINFKNSIETFRVVVGYRFLEKGIFTKSPMDLIPKKLQ
jgi:hypothetical protein